MIEKITFKFFIFIISIIAFFFGNAWLAKNEKDITKGTEDFLAIMIIIVSIIMFLIGIFII